jgi:hypothetical protein
MQQNNAGDETNPRYTAWLSAMVRKWPTRVSAKSLASSDTGRWLGRRMASSKATSGWNGLNTSPAIGELPGLSGLFADFGHSHYGPGMVDGSSSNAQTPAYAPGRFD